MRIWWQSSLALGTDPAWNPYQEALKSHLQRVARGDTQVDVMGVKFVEPIMGRSAYVRYLNEAQIIENAFTAEQDGYDVFSAGCTLDPGCAEIKEITEIPVVFLFETCTHLAYSLAGRFALLAFNPNVLRLHEQMVRQYQLGECLVPCDTLLNMTSKDLSAGIKNPGPILSAVAQVGRKAVENGAGMFISTCNILNMIFVTSGFRDIDGVPILDTAGTTLKMAETMVDLKQIGVTRSRKGNYTSLPKEELMRVRKLYGVAR